MSGDDQKRSAYKPPSLRAKERAEAAASGNAPMRGGPDNGLGDSRPSGGNRRAMGTEDSRGPRHGGNLMDRFNRRTQQAQRQPGADEDQQTPTSRTTTPNTPATGNDSQSTPSHPANRDFSSMKRPASGRPPLNDRATQGFRERGLVDFGAPAFRGGPSPSGRGSNDDTDGQAARPVGRRPATGEDGAPIDTVKAWKERGKRPDKAFDIDKEALLIFGDPEKKKGGGSGINFDSFFDIPVSLTGEGFEDIKEIPSFQEAGASIHPLLMENIGRIGYNKPTPVQKWSIPCIFAGRDLMACAQTGSGKTAAFLFPIISKMLNDGPPSNRRVSPMSQRPNALVLSPTRELATQIFDETKKFCFNTGIRPVVVYGGQPIRDQNAEMRSGCDVCIATPGRLIDHITRSTIDLSECHYFVLDEADRMLDMGFVPQITEIVENYNLPAKETRQTIMFSATFPAVIQRLAEDFMNEYLFLTVGRVGSTNECITQVVLYADERQKPTRLLGLLKEVDGLTLIFVETKKKADIIHEFLSVHDIGAVSIHGDRTQAEREAALDMFRAGQEVSVMVATDVVGRGLDIPNVTHVINHDMPPSIDDYVHRIGRTGRAGNKGRATTFITEFNGNVLRDLVTVLEEAKQDTPSWLLDMISSGSSLAKGRGLRPASGGGGGFGGRDVRNDISAYGMAVDQGRRVAQGMSVDHRYAQNTGMTRGFGGAPQGQHGGYRTVTKKKQADEEFDGW